MRLALIVEYDGTAYSGYQYQDNAPSIQEELETAIMKLTREKTRVSGAGRTDAGVHALGQVVAFDTEAGYPPGTFVKALNRHLPDDIAVKEAHSVDLAFDPRRMAMSRRYVYSMFAGATRSPLSRRTSYRVGKGLKLDRMRRAARHLVGVHDFAGFAGPLERPEASTVREMFEARVRSKGDYITMEFEGSAFLPHQVRRMAGALVDVGFGRLSPSEVMAMVNRRPGAAVARSLPPHGLCLSRVEYANFPPKAGA
jgi:tRNA pseudouridine38-40 synthase